MATSNFPVVSRVLWVIRPGSQAAKALKTPSRGMVRILTEITSITSRRPGEQGRRHLQRAP